MKAKKVGIIYSGGKYWGGVETYLSLLFDLYDKEKVELCLISLGNWELSKKLQEKEGKVFVLSGKRMRLKTFAEITQLIKKEKIDLLVSQGVVANFYARLSAFFSGVPNLVTVHSELAQDYNNVFIKYAYLFSDIAFSPITKKYITVSHFLKNNLTKRGINKKKIDVIYNGVQLSGQKEDFHSPKHDKIVIGSIGRLHKVKGYDNLIEAANILEDKNPNFRIVIWGDGPEKENLNKKIKDFEIDHHVELAGFEPDLNKILSRVDVYIQPSLSEGFGLTVVEAMLAGRPVIVTPAGALKEIVNNGITGIISKSTEPKDLADSILKMLEDKELGKELSVCARNYAVREFDPEKWANKTIKAYLEVTK
ncbi:MAG: Glycosyl transferase group 1 [candidate division CPR2 bacterium GW2011_GWC2_39_10]|uniref:Glycosyl transferase group 1 n=1 Tax=candidate division CPR2 bacterium GW2011_GWC2_39_10 TaxID=1618345 RepID=A0A0G0PYH0_UNCC2|nr:MAG: Glycosyl transferase group 1 [candidate division CPR2 bacterium GW2011_GWC2_39_10]